MLNLTICFWVLFCFDFGFCWVGWYLFRCFLGWVFGTVLLCVVELEFVGFSSDVMILIDLVLWCLGFIVEFGGLAFFVVLTGWF